MTPLLLLQICISYLEIQMNNSLLVHVFDALQYLRHIPHNFLLSQVVIIADFLKQFTARNSTKTFEEKKRFQVSEK